MSYAELAARAEQALPPSVWSYVAGGAGDEHTQDGNVTAFRGWGLMPRMLVGATERDLSVELWGKRWPAPIFMAPIGVIALCDRDGHGDLATARAAARTGVPMCASTLVEDPMEAVAAEFGDTPGFSSCTARPTGNWPRAWCAAPSPPATRASSSRWTPGSPAGGPATSRCRISRSYAANAWRTTPATRCSGRRPALTVGGDPRDAVMYWASIFGKPLTWDDLTWLRSLTELPLILKGICHPDDARRAADYGVDGIYCSNHGGRQANGGLPAIDCLPGVVEAAGDLPVLFDSGVRSGADVIKALALGASAVGIGRPYAYGLALGGVDGIVHVLRSILAEADLIMAVDGYPTLADLTPEALRRVERLGRASGSPERVGALSAVVSDW